MCWGRDRDKATPPAGFTATTTPTMCPSDSFGSTCTLSCSACETHGSITPTKCGFPSATSCGCSPGWQGPVCTIPNTGVYLTSVASSDCPTTRTITPAPGCPFYIIPSDCSTTASSTITVSGVGFASGAIITVGGGASHKFEYLLTFLSVYERNALVCGGHDELCTVHCNVKSKFSHHLAPN